jgi:hypothetical protein
MGKPISYYGVEVEPNGDGYKSQLVNDMVESWGEDLSGINSRTTLLLISALAEVAAAKDSAPVDSNLNEVISRIGEISEYDMISLIQALAN